MILTSNGGGQKKFDIKGSNPFSFQQTFSKLEFSSNYRDRSSQSKKCNHETTGCSIRFQNNGGCAALTGRGYWGVCILISSSDHHVARFVGIIARYIIARPRMHQKQYLGPAHYISRELWPGLTRDLDFHQPRKVILATVDEDWPVKSRSSS